MTNRIFYSHTAKCKYLVENLNIYYPKKTFLKLNSFCWKWLSKMFHKFIVSNTLILDLFSDTHFYESKNFQTNKTTPFHKCIYFYLLAISIIHKFILQLLKLHLLFLLIIDMPTRAILTTQRKILFIYCKLVPFRIV